MLYKTISSSTNMIFNVRVCLLNQDSQTGLLQNKREQKWVCASSRKTRLLTAVKEQVHKKDTLMPEINISVDRELDICSDAEWPIDTKMPLNTQDALRGHGHVTFGHCPAVQRADECPRPGGMLRLRSALSVAWRTRSTSSSQRAPRNKAAVVTVFPP